MSCPDEDVPQPTQPLTWVPPGHFYSPLVDPENIDVRNAFLACEQGDLDNCCGIDFSGDIILDWMRRLARHYGKPGFPEHAEQGWRYHFDNAAFAFGDAIVYSGMVQELRPRRIVEIGAGFSSCLAMDVNDHLFCVGGRN